VRRRHLICSCLAGWLSLILTCSGCKYSLVCSKLERPACPRTASVPCGCFDLVKMTGGFAGETLDPRDNGMHEAIIIRSDSTVEFYRNDSMFSRSSFRVTKESVTYKGKREDRTILELTNHLEPTEASFTIGVEDLNHLWYSQRGVSDGFYFLYVRYR